MSTDVATKKCKFCQTDIDAKASICPNCKKEQKKKFPVWAIILIVVVLLCSVSAAGSGKGNNTSSGTSSNTSNSPAEKSYSKGEEVTVDDLKIKIINAKSLGSSIAQAYGSPIKTQGKFIQVDFQVENIGKEAQYMGKMQLVDDKDRTFDESDNKFSILGDKVEFLDKFNPNVKTNYSTVFDVAADAKGLKLKTSGFGLFNTTSVLISLGL